MPASMVAVSAGVDGVAVRVGGPDCAAAQTGSSTRVKTARGRMKICITTCILTVIQVAACSADSTVDVMSFGLDSRHAVSITRQPILDPKARVFGYQLLYECGPSSLESVDAVAARTLSEAILSIGIDPLSCG